MLKEAEEAKQRMVTGDVSPPDTFCFKDIVKPPDDPAKYEDSVVRNVDISSRINIY